MSDAYQSRLETLEQELAAARAEAETLRERLTETQAKTEALYTLLQQAPIPISIMQGPDHVVSFSNEANLRVTKLSEEETIGKSAREIFAGRGYEPLFDLLDQVYTTGEPFHGESPPAPFERHGTGTLVPTIFNTLYYPSRDSDGQINGVMSFATDVTDLVEARQRTEAINDELEARVAARTQEIEQLNQQVIEAQRQALRELSTPLIPITDEVVIMPLVGTMDSQRAQQVLETLLEGIAHYQAELAIIDITGVSVVDTQVAQSLIQAAQAVNLLGAQVMLTGIQPRIAQTLIHLGVDLSNIQTRGSLQSGVSAALNGAKHRVMA
jgi:rsbT co-antagonist protein RsbR